MMLKKVNYIYLFILVIITTLLLLAGYHHYSSFYFSSDGFHYYSAMRNFVNAQTVWEGPTFEYLLGNHAYLSLYILSPLVWLFPSPFILLVLTVLSHIIAVFLIYKITYHFSSKWTQGSLVAFSLAFLYLMYPFVNSTLYARTYLFQPDYMLPPLVLGLLWSALVSNRKLFLVCTALILLTKEEYIALYPLIFFWIWWLTRLIDRTNGFWSRKLLVWSGFVYVLISAVSVGVLLYFRDLNEINQAARSIEPLRLFTDPPSLGVLTNILWEALKPIVAIMIWALVLMRKSPRKIIILTFISILYPLGRLLVNHVIYHRVEGMDWANIIISPLVVGTGVILVIITIRNTTAVKSNIYTLLVLLLVTNVLLFLRNSRRQPFEMIASYVTGTTEAKFNTEEVEALKKVMKPPRSERSFFITAEHLQFPFMSRSHVSKDWVAGLSDEIQDRIIADADYIIFQKKPIDSTLLKKSEHVHTLAIETENFLLYEKRAAGY